MAFSKDKLKADAKLHLKVRIRTLKMHGKETKHEDRILKDKHNVI